MGTPMPDTFSNAGHQREDAAVEGRGWLIERRHHYFNPLMVMASDSTFAILLGKTPTAAKITIRARLDCCDSHRHCQKLQAGKQMREQNNPRNDKAPPLGLCDVAMAEAMAIANQSQLIEAAQGIFVVGV